MQLTEPESLRAIDDEGVHRRKVDARLHDCGAHENVEAPLPEVDHDALKRTFIHLSVGDGDARVGHQLAESSRHLIDVGHAVVHEEDLTLAQ